MANHRIFKNRNLTSVEAKRRFDDRHAAIDEQLDEAFKKVDEKRKKKGTKSFIDFVQTYCIGLMIDEPPSDRFVEALKEMEFAMANNTPYNIELPRGSGKTSAAEMLILYLLSTGKKKFAVIIS